MKEEAQLKAMAAELVAQGCDVRTDVPGAELGLGDDAGRSLGQLQLDIVAKSYRRREDAPDTPKILIIEVANRTRRAPQTGAQKILTLPRFVDDEDAMLRFDLLSSAIAGRPEIDLEIRFFDVSADQANARALPGGVGGKRLSTCLAHDQRLLARSTRFDDIVRALIVARLWARWVRLAGNLNPGRARRELKLADLRTIQKDLFDQKVLTLTPHRYRVIHNAVLAIVEGGDIEPKLLLELEPDLRTLIRWAADHFGVKYQETDGFFGPIVQEIFNLIEANSDGPRRDDLIGAIAAVGFSQGTAVFAKQVAYFMLVLGRDQIVPDQLITDLLESAATQ